MKNPDFMHSQCRRGCGLCKAPPLSAPEILAAAAAAAAPGLLHWDRGEQRDGLEEHRFTPNVQIAQGVPGLTLSPQLAAQQAQQAAARKERWLLMELSLIHI